MAAVIAEDATALISWINNHGKVCKIFDEAQKIISLDRLGKIIILAYLLAVLQNRSAIIAAEVGTTTSTEGTSINQKDSTRLDQVLLTIAGIFLRFADHLEPEVKKAMLIHLEKRWKDCDQHVFLAALVLNLFEKLSCFGPNTNLNASVH
ncbi:hypothetical protein B0H10DRAFT_1957205 [Mycena sp. CBHHK59/15]|nr:hypothetical protein B0H10DRAFT_1957205 [Mycena sp. CBHHK59/15]